LRRSSSNGSIHSTIIHSTIMGHSGASWATFRDEGRRPRPACHCARSFNRGDTIHAPADPAPAIALLGTIDDFSRGSATRGGMMAIMDAIEQDLRIVDNPDEGRYEAFVGDRLAGLVAYRLRTGQVVFLHTEVLPAFEGRGIGSRLAAGVLDDARARGLAVVPRCPFIAAYIRRHPEYAYLVPGRGGDST
jgi:predicted GNAT family acetyltransferase